MVHLTDKAVLSFYLHKISFHHMVTLNDSDCCYDMSVSEYGACKMVHLTDKAVLSFYLHKISFHHMVTLDDSGCCYDMSVS